MITAVDTSVLLDLFGADSQFGLRSKEVLRRCSREGRLIACEAVFAEVRSAFAETEKAQGALAAIGVELEPMTVPASLKAGEAFRLYRLRGGQRERVVADFLVGAHALECADRLLTRDRGFHRTYFGGLEIVDPSRS